MKHPIIIIIIISRDIVCLRNISIIPCIQVVVVVVVMMIMIIIIIINTV